MFEGWFEELEAESSQEIFINPEGEILTNSPDDYAKRIKSELLKYCITFEDQRGFITIELKKVYVVGVNTDLLGYSGSILVAYESLDGQFGTFEVYKSNHTNLLFPKNDAEIDALIQEHVDIPFEDLNIIQQQLINGNYDTVVGKNYLSTNGKLLTEIERIRENLE